MKNRFWLSLVTLLFILVNYHLAFFTHEYAHSFIASWLGHKEFPLHLNFGDFSWENIILLSKVDENVNYDQILSYRHYFHAAFIAFAGILIGNGIPYLISLWLLLKKSIQLQPLFYYFLFWLNFMSLGNWYAYVPIRTFSYQGDMANISKSLNLAPAWIAIILIPIVIFQMCIFYRKTLPITYRVLALSGRGRKLLLIICTSVLLGYFGMAGFLDNGLLSHYLSALSFILIFPCIFMMWKNGQTPKFR